MSPQLIVKKTGICRTLKSAADARYLCDDEVHSVRVPVPLIAKSLPDFLSEPVVLFSKTGGILKKIEPESVPKIIANGKVKMVKSGILSPQRMLSLMRKSEEGEQLFILRYRPKPAPTPTEYVARRMSGEVFPLTYAARLEWLKAGGEDHKSIAEKIKICGLVIRAKLKAIDPSLLRRQRLPGSKEDISVFAHNLVVAPSPSILKRILDQKLAVDDVLELAARRAVEWLERKRGAKIYAFAGLHMTDSTTVRPHLHVRMVAHDSNGKYIALFNRKHGSSRGNQVIFQHELVRQISRLIERTELREREK